MEQSDPFLERTYLLDGTELTCRFYQPVSDGQDFSCRYEIKWPDGLRSRSAWGVDSVQSLLLAMQAMHSDLLLRRERDGLEVRWLDGRELGLPPLSGNTSATRG
ncbi:DUF6968 family protein [Qipengyuania sp.]|uniref:DUF6968 family protein n=1 Tax=Qipengyuania sp. TaxID=2004515 RepID=UPI003BAA50D2